jgi:class 3 adenylate cyclase
MKRLLITTLIIGAVVAAVVSVLHATGLLLGLENAVGGFVSDHAGATRVVGEKWQYVLVSLMAFGVVSLTHSGVPRVGVRLIIVLLTFELLGLSWVCSLYGVFFQPLPSVFAVALAWIATEGWTAFLQRNRSHLVRTFFANRLSKKEFHRVRDGTISFDIHPKTYAVSVVTCDIANKYGFAEDSEPGAFARTLAEFIRDTADRLLQAGAYLQTADGEGVVAIFGFPGGDSGHAEKASREVLNLVRDFRKQQQNNGDALADCDIHAGVCSGTIIVAPTNDNGSPALLISGEPLDLSRRFCAANRRYGSKILMDTLTFDLANDAIVARPIDFVDGVSSQDRHEIYEPLWLATEAGPEHVARRDCFWSGVVLYREKRWAEAYTEFQKARGSEEEEDLPLQFYLRRLEVRTLSELAETPPESGSGGF